MPIRKVEPNILGNSEDIIGNNAAFKCAIEYCGKVFIINTTRIHNGKRSCPKCGKSTVTLKAEGGPGTRVIEALIEWD